jgi:hypothetical protein
MLTSLTLAYMSKSSDKSVVSDFRTTPSQSSESVPPPANPVPDAQQSSPPAMNPNANMDISDTPGSQPTAPAPGDVEMPGTRDHTGADQ